MKTRLCSILICLASFLILPNTAQAKICDVNDKSYSKQSRACPDSAVAHYNIILKILNSSDKKLYNKNKRYIQYVFKHFSNFEPIAQLANKDPYAAIAHYTEQHLKAYNAAFQSVALKAVPPNKPKLPALPKLVKGKYEKTPTFKQRIQEAREVRQAEVLRIEAKYQSSVARFNRAVEENNRANKQALAKHKASIPSKRLQYTQQAFTAVLGVPILTELEYDADAERFHARIQSLDERFNEPVTLDVPIGIAPQFEKNLRNIKPRLVFDLIDNRLQLKNIMITDNDTDYVAQLSDGNYQPEMLAVSINDVVIPDFTRIETLTPERIDTAELINERYFSSALAMEKDPELAKLRQQQAELSRKSKEAKRAKAGQKYRLRLKAQIAQQELELAAMGGDLGSQYRGIRPITKWQFDKVAPKPDTIAVIIGNRNYGKGVPMVHYAHNDAKAVKQFVEEVWQLPPENIIYEEDATKGVMEGIFLSTLPSRIKRGKSNVMVYFSGHGMAADDDAKLLPIDARPSTASVTGYSRTTLMRQLEDLNIKSYSLVLDACYTGTSKEGSALLAGKPVALKVAKAKKPKNGVLITASQNQQIAWMDDKSGHSLFTYHFLEGLKGKADINKDGEVNVKELGKYLGTTVNRAALLLHEQPQTPQVSGNNISLVKY